MPAPQTIACLGSSSTAARGSYDWIADLQSRPRNANLRLLNFGVGGDLAFNALRRLPTLIAERPQKVVILIGANDVLTRVSRKLRRILRVWKFLPRRPSIQWYEQSLRQIVLQLKHQTDAQIALCSLAPIGENLNSTDPFQQAINRKIRDYNTIIQKIAQEQGTSYIPFYERLMPQIAAFPPRSLTDVHILGMYRDAFRLLVRHWTLDQLAARNGWHFHTDGIHLNPAGGKILADLVQEFLDTPLPG
jgi:lysophospholipase L1-like esterase